MRKDPPTGETELYWKSIWDKETSHNTNPQWLLDLREGHSHPQDPGKNTMSDIQKESQG